MLAQKPGVEEAGDTQSVEVETAEQEGGEIDQSDPGTETMQAGSGT